MTKRYEVIFGNTVKVIEAEKKEYVKETGQTFFLDGMGKILHIVPKEAFVTMTEGYTELGDKLNDVIFQLRAEMDENINKPANLKFLNHLITTLSSVYEDSRGN